MGVLLVLAAVASGGAVGVAGGRRLEPVLAEGEEVDGEVKAVGDQVKHWISLLVVDSMLANLGGGSDVQVFVQ